MPHIYLKKNPKQIRGFENLRIEMIVLTIFTKF